MRNNKTLGMASSVLGVVLTSGFLFALSHSVLAAENPPLDKGLKPEEEEEVSNVFRDMGVVQRRAMPKAGRFLFSTFGTFDFSDGPFTNYSIHTNPGIAVSDFFEIYANVAPLYIVTARSIVTKISSLTLQNGDRASITAARPKFQYGLDFLWAPAYGKDSLGISKVIRSDTFFKLSIGRINYDTETGMRFALGLGKTYFIGKAVGLRFCMDFGYIQQIIDGQKAFHTLALAELGAVFYL